MKLKTGFSKVLILVLSFLIGMGSTLTFATKDESAELALSYFRYANGTYQNGYALNTSGNEGESHKPIFQIMSSTNKTNYYCLNATAGESWVTGTIGTNAAYNRTYDLNLASDIKLLEKDTNSVYKNVAGSYLNQILWILDNLYVPSGDAETNLAQKRELLAKAGIVYELTGETDLNGDPVKNYTYKYQAQTGYDYKDKLKTLGYSETTTKQGWFYYEKDTDEFKRVELPDEMVEVAGQAALWYYTNYLENNSSNSQTYNVKSQGLLLASSNGTTETNSGNWKSLRNAIFNKETNVEDYSATVGMWQEEQATILCWYLIDAADKYAESNTSATGNPLKITPATTKIEAKQVSSEEFQVVGPIKIDEQRTAVYTLSNDITIAVDGSTKTNTGAYISDANGNRKSNQNVSNYVGQEFYVAIPSSKIDGNEVKISFNGTYKTNEKKLWVNTTKTEQPVVEVTPENEPLKLEVTAKIEDVKEFDLALRKRITKLTDSKGTIKSIINEASKPATRSLEYVATDIATYNTATYKHRKDPVVVEKGDIITYGVTIYNEGDKAGYATTIVDKLPQGLALKGYTASNTTTGTYTKGNVKYTYVYNPSTNEITFTNVNKNDLAAYEGGTTLVSETIEIECEVVKDPSTTANTYLTNIAYITKEHNSVDNKDITNEEGADRDSIPLTYPTTTQVTTGTTYNGYKGNTTNQSVYNDTNNEYYYKGQEDDDDFEIVVIKKAEFDLALRKFISKVSADGTFENIEEVESREPEVDTTKLKARESKTATYNHSKKPIYLEAGDYVLYTIRVYNEGEVDGYASEIIDYLPEYLDFVTEQKANEYNQYWTYDQATRKVTTKSNAKNATTKLSAFNKEEDDGKGSGLSYVDVQIVCKVNNNTPENKKLTNIAEITEYKDKDGNTLEKDRDSEPKNFEEPQNRETYNDDKISKGDKYIPGQQDDDDFEKVIVKTVDIHKGVKTVENQDSGYNKDEEQTWIITSDIPSDIATYKKYEITDNIDYRLNFSGINKVQVKIGETTLVKDTDYTITYTKNESGVTDKTTSGTLKLVFINKEAGKNVTENLTKNAGEKINITFKTTFATDAQGNLLAKIGEEIENQAKLDYTNSSNISKEKKTEKPEVHTGGVTLYKYDEESKTKNPLKGAEFAIYKTEADAKAKKNEVFTETSGEDGIVRFTGLEYGEDASDKEENETSSGIYEYDSTKQSTKYYVAETKAPEGYIAYEDVIEVTINSTSYEEDSKKITYQVPNTPITGKYDVILIKEDQNGEDLKSEAIFEVNGESKEVTGRLTIAKDVEINKSNLTTADVYTIKETKAPDKYCEFDGTITVTVTKKLADDGKSYVVDKIDYKVIDSKGNDISDTKDAKVYLKDGNLYVEVIDYEKEFDLKLMKFISEVNGKKTDRNITVDASNLNKIVDGKKVTTATYNVSKKPIEVKLGDYVTYTFRIYNEGELDGYAKEITEDIPEGLKFVTEEDSNLTEKDKAAIEFNKSFSWNAATKSADGSAKTISTDYLSKAKNKDNLLKAFDGETMLEPDSKDISVMFKVVSKDTSKIIRNEAEISDDEDEDGNPVNDRDSKPEEWKKEDSDDYYDNDKDYPKYKEDDEDYDNIIIKKVDLALTKFIVAISDDMNFEDGEYLTKDTTSKNAGSKENPYTRQTAVDTTPLKEGTVNDAIYTRVKTPITVPEESYVLYNIRVYNEGEVDVYAGEVADYLPNYLDFISCEFNDNFGWKVGTDGKTVKTSYLSHTNGTDKMLKAFDKENDDGAGSKLDYKDLQILTRVNSKAPDATKLVNTAEITKYEDENGKEIEEDIDSKPENVPEKNKEQRVEDDDDWEVVEVVKKKVDLALSKFIAAISDDTEIVDGEYLTPNGKVGSKENPYTRATAVDTKELRDNPECHDASYSKVKDPLVVPAKSYVLYDIRVYNEGETDVYAGEVTDHLPDYLDFVSCKFNDNFEWKVESDGKTIKTTYLSYEKGEKKLLKAFDRKTDDGAGSGLDYRDLQVLCKVSDNAPSNTNIVNVAEITKYEDKDGNDIPEDIDSTPDNVDKKNEDDDDYEVLLIKTFDLSLLKWVSTVYVTEDGKTKTIQTGNTGDDNTDIIPKVEINRKKVNSSMVKFGYTIKITNEGDIEGYAKEITDYVPEGLKFYKEDNNGWEDKGNGTITTRLLENTLLKPGDTAEVTVIFRWINGSNNLGLKTNIAEISEDYNKEGIPDRDSTPGNKVWGEDDIDDAKVLLSISTGLVENIIMYAIGATIILVVLAGGIIGIKKFVL